MFIARIVVQARITEGWMAIEKHFAGNQTQKTVGELYCSEELKEERLGELIFVSVLNIFSVHYGISGEHSDPSCSSQRDFTQ